MKLERAEELLHEFPTKRILVIGDLMLDEFVWGRVSRISPEAPVPVVEVIRESYYPGGAANVARNVREFTPAVFVMGLIGEDSHAQKLRELLGANGIGLEGLQLRRASLRRFANYSRNWTPLFSRITEKVCCSKILSITSPHWPEEPANW